MSGVNWVSATVVLGAGLAVGLLFARRALAQRAPAGGISLERRDLVAKRDVLLSQLRELSLSAAGRSPEQLGRERYSLELEAARVLQRLDALPAERAPAAAPSSGPPGNKPALRGFLWGTTSMAALALLLYMAAGAAKPREEVGSPAPPAAATDPEEAQARAALGRNPDDLEARLALARVLLARQDMMGVWNETQYVLERRPGDPRALSYQALVRLAMGQAEVALEMLKKAIAAAPHQIDAYVHLALVYAQMGRSKDFAKTMAEAKKRFPDQAAMLARLEAEIGRASPEAASLPGDPHAAVPAPATAGQAKGRGVAGVLDLDPLAASDVPPRPIVFITLREAGFGAGPPMAVKRLVAASFPLRFEIGAADSMTGEAIPNEVLIEARIDSDGDPLTRSPSDPKARLDDVKVGASDLRLVLKR